MSPIMHSFMETWTVWLKSQLLVRTWTRSKCCWAKWHRVRHTTVPWESPGDAQLKSSCLNVCLWSRDDKNVIAVTSVRASGWKQKWCNTAHEESKKRTEWSNAECGKEDNKEKRTDNDLVTQLLYTYIYIYIYHHIQTKPESLASSGKKILWTGETKIWFDQNDRKRKE